MIDFGPEQTSSTGVRASSSEIRGDVAASRVDAPDAAGRTHGDARGPRGPDHGGHRRRAEPAARDGEGKFPARAPCPRGPVPRTSRAGRRTGPRGPRRPRRRSTRARPPRHGRHRSSVRRTRGCAAAGDPGRRRSSPGRRPRRRPRAPARTSSSRRTELIDGAAPARSRSSPPPSRRRARGPERLARRAAGREPREQDPVERVSRARRVTSRRRAGPRSGSRAPPTTSPRPPRRASRRRSGTARARTSAASSPRRPDQHLGLASVRQQHRVAGAVSSKNRSAPKSRIERPRGAVDGDEPGRARVAAPPSPRRTSARTAARSPRPGPPPPRSVSGRSSGVRRPVRARGPPPSSARRARATIEHRARVGLGIDRERGLDAAAR